MLLTEQRGPRVGLGVVDTPIKVAILLHRRK